MGLRGSVTQTEPPASVILKPMMVRLEIQIFGSNFWDPHWKRNYRSISDSKDSGWKNFNRILLLKNQEIGIPIPKFGIPKKINIGIQYFSFCE